MNEQKQHAENNERANAHSYAEVDLGLLSIANLRKHVVTNVNSSKLLSKNICPLRVLHA